MPFIRAVSISNFVVKAKEKDIKQVGRFSVCSRVVNFIDVSSVSMDSNLTTVRVKLNSIILVVTRGN